MPPLHPRPAVRSRLACAIAAPVPMQGRPAPDSAPRPALRVNTGLVQRLVQRALAVGGLALAGWLPLGAQAQTVYVSSEKDHKVHVMDAAGKLQSSISVCQRPRDLKPSPDRSRIYVVCGDSNQLGVIDRASGKQIDSLKLGDSPELLDLSPDGKTAYVTIEDESVLAAYDLASKKPLFKVRTGGEPEGVLITPDGKTAYVTSEDANVVHVIDLAARKVVKDIKAGQRPRRFALSPDGKELWVTNELGASVSVIDTGSQSVKATLEFRIAGLRASDITPVGVTMTRDGQTAWVSLGRANQVAEVDMASRQVRRTVLAGKRAWGLALSPDEAVLYVTNGLSDDMTLIDTRQGKAIRTVAVGRVPHTPLVLAR